MANEYRDFAIKIHCNEAFYRALVLMLRHAEKLRDGRSRDLGIFFDGDGHDRLKLLYISEPLGESDKGIKETGDFFIDTDEVYSSL